MKTTHGWESRAVPVWCPEPVTRGYDALNPASHKTMAPNAKKSLLRAYMKCTRFADRLARACGQKICKLNYNKLLKDLGPTERAELEDPSVGIPLKLFMDAFEKDEQLEVIARIFASIYMRKILKIRAGITKAINDNPDVLNTPIVRPVILIGFPRTGTTMLHHMLAQDPHLKAPMLWELMRPFPPGRPDNWRHCKRYRDIVNLLSLRAATGEGGLDVAHALQADHPEECLNALGRNYLQYYFHLRIRSLSSVEEWYYSLTKDELVNIYRHYRKTLQLIFHKGLDQHRLVLKSNTHLLNLEALLEVFPDACLVFTHRPMTEVLPSFCSTIHKATQTWGPLDDEFGSRVLRLLAEFGNRTAATMQKYEGLPKESQPFYSVSYEDLTKDPLQAVRDIYDHFALDYSPEAENNFCKWLTENPQHKHGVHKYSMEQYGVTEADIVSRMGPYLEYFKDKSTKLI